MTDSHDQRGPDTPGPRMPDWIRAAIEKQGKVDPDEIERQAALVDLDAERPGDRPPPQPPKQDTLDLGISIPTAKADA